MAYSILEQKDDDKIEFVQFHQNYSYEDFIMGYKPSKEGFALKYGVFYNFCNSTRCKIINKLVTGDYNSPNSLECNMNHLLYEENGYLCY